MTRARWIVTLAPPAAVLLALLTDVNDVSEAIHISGRLGKNAGSGTVELNVATLTQDEKAQLCTSKERDWT